MEDHGNDSSSARAQGEQHPDTFSPGTLLDGRYRIQRRIGEGGHWRVFRGEDVVSGQAVVVKIADTPHAITESRFRREVQLGARLHHPNIVPLQGYGKTPNGEPYLAFAWIEGRTLEERIDADGSLAWREAAHITAQLARALAAGHEAAVVHRDVKPANVVFDSATGRPMLLDFSAFGDIGVDTGDAFTLAGGTIVGTPMYMAPEQLMGRAQSSVTDIYGLGLVLYEMLFGRQSSPGSFKDVARRTLQGMTVPADPAIPVELLDLLREMLQTDPARRPQSTVEVAKRLERLEQLDEHRVAARSTAAPVARTVTSAVHVAPSMRSAQRRGRSLSVGAVSALFAFVVVAGVILLAVWSRPAGSPGPQLPIEPGPPPPTENVRGTQPAQGLLQGIALIGLGALIGGITARALAHRGAALETEASRLLLGTKGPRGLSKTIALEIDELLARSKQIDVRILGVTIVQMMHEYDRAKASETRQSALMHAVTLLEKLHGRLSPWYVQHRKALAAIPATMGGIAGCGKIVVEMVKMLKAG